MDINIKNHSSGHIAGVTHDNQLLTRTESHELQHHTAFHKGESYQVQYIDTGITAKTQTILHIRNDDPTRKLVMSYVRIQHVGDATMPAVTDYYEIGTGTTVGSGGSAVTPVNTSPSSGKSASVTVTGNDPTMAGTLGVLDTHFLESNGNELVYNKHGSIVLGLNDTFEIRHTSTSTTGSTKARVTFMMIESEDGH